MAILLFILLVVYVAVVSTPISMSLAGLILARNGHRELQLLPGSTTVRSGASVQPLSGSEATATQLFGTKMYMSREEDHEQAIVFSIKEKADHLSVRHSRPCRQRSFPHARLE